MAPFCVYTATCITYYCIPLICIGYYSTYCIQSGWVPFWLWAGLNKTARRKASEGEEQDAAAGIESKAAKLRKEWRRLEAKESKESTGMGAESTGHMLRLSPLDYGPACISHRRRLVCSSVLNGVDDSPPSIHSFVNRCITSSCCFIASMPLAFTWMRFLLRLC